MQKQTTTKRTIVVEMTAGGASGREIAEKINITDRSVRRHRAAAKVPGTPGRREVGGQIAEEVLLLARRGMQRNAIAKRLGIAEGTVKRIAFSAGLSFPRGGDRRSVEARAARREAPGGLYDKRIDVDTAATWAGSGYRHGQLAAAWHGQKELPRTLKKLI